VTCANWLLFYLSHRVEHNSKNGYHMSEIHNFKSFLLCKMIFDRC
jgi:hypothetical protein